MENQTTNALPDFKLNEQEIPVVKIKKIHFKDFKAFEDFEISFLDLNENPIKFSCLFGPNGCGKTTVLESIANIFSNYDSYEPIRLTALLGKLVRHVEGESISHISSEVLEGTEELYGNANVDFNNIDNNDDFLLTADIACSTGDYSVSLSKNGFVNDHPAHVKAIFNRIYYAARFDQELHQFQLLRDKWPVFKELFEAVTGFEIEEKRNVFHYSEDPVQAELFEKYVVEFSINKPDETISHSECSAGERKIIKSFSTLLNKEYAPQIILIDNIAMHVESGRHLELVNSLKKSFPNSQIFSTTHSHNISKNFGNKTELHDLRFIKMKGLMRQEPWRIYLQDDIKDHILKIKSVTRRDEATNALIQIGYDLIEECQKNPNRVKLTEDAVAYMQKIVGLYVEDTVKYYS